jgi:hypothetical protein
MIAMMVAGRTAMSCCRSTSRSTCSTSAAATLRARPLRNRRRTLEDLVDGSEVFPIRRLPDDGFKESELVQVRGYEGLVAK